MRIALLILLSLAGAVAQTFSLPTTLTTRDGVIYLGASYTRHDAANVYFTYEDGAASVPLANLPDDLRERFHYDKAAAEATLAAQAAARRKYVNSVAEIRVQQREEAERQAIIKNLKPEDVFKIAGKILRKEGDFLIIYCEEKSVSSLGGEDEVKTVPVSETPASQIVSGTLALIGHPRMTELGMDDVIECTAMRNGAAGDYRRFDFVEPPAPPMLAPSQRIFEPTLLEKMTRESGH